MLCAVVKLFVFQTSVLFQGTHTSMFHLFYIVQLPSIHAVIRIPRC